MPRGAGQGLRGLPREARYYFEFWAGRARSAGAQVLYGFLMLLAAALFIGFYFVEAMIIGAIGYAIDAANGVHQNPGKITVTPALFIANNLSLVLLVPAAMLAAWLISGQRPKFLSSVVGGIRWRWLLKTLWVVLPLWVVWGIAIPALGGAFKDLQANASTPLMLAAVVLTTPLQAAGEEYAFRGLLSRAVAATVPATSSAILRALAGALGCVASSTVFMLLHGAGDVWLNVFYFVFGAIAWYLTWRTGGLEAAIAIHVVNNVFSELTLPWTDFSSMFDREAGTGSSAAVLLQLVVLVFAAVGVEVLMRIGALRPRRLAAPGNPELDWHLGQGAVSSLASATSPASVGWGQPGLLVPPQGYVPPGPDGSAGPLAWQPHDPTAQPFAAGAQHPHAVSAYPPAYPLGAGPAGSRPAAGNVPTRYPQPTQDRPWPPAGGGQPPLNG